MSKIIGIDLGANLCRAAVWEGGEVVHIRDADGGPGVPVAVAIDRNGRWLVGREARKLMDAEPQRAGRGIRQALGSGARFDLGDGRERTATELYAAVLQRVRANAESYLGERVKDASIAVPASFGFRQYRAVREAARIAGFRQVRLGNGAFLASVPAGMGAEGAHRLLVCSLGNAFDFAAVELGDGIFESLAVAGRAEQGDSIDQSLADMLARQFYRRTGADLTRLPAAMARLRAAAAKAKVELCSRMSVNVNLPFIVSGSMGFLHLDIDLTRAELNAAAAQAARSAAAMAREMIQTFGMADGPPSRILLTGASARMPLLREAMNGLGLEILEDPDGTAAVTGAAMRGALLNGEVRSFALLDTQPVAVGIRTAGDGFTPVIDEHTTIPVKQTQTFSTSSDGQTSVEVQVMERVDSQTRDLGSASLDGLPAMPQGVPKIDITFAVDLFGELYVTARDQGTGREKRFALPDRADLTEEELQAAIRDAETRVPEPPKPTDARPTESARRPAPPPTDKATPPPGHGQPNLREETLREIIEAILPAMDNLERAIQAAQWVADGEAMVKGMELTMKSLTDALARYGLEEIPAEGQRFDPTVHNAVASEVFGPPGWVLEVYQRGYRLNGRVLRYASVKVSVEN